MRIAQIILPDASAYERKSQRADRAALVAQHELVDDVRNANVAHVYTSSELTRGLDVPYVSSMPLRQSRWPWRKGKEPAFVATWQTLPEVVEDEYYASSGLLGAPRSSSGSASEELRETGGTPRSSVIGSFARKSTVNMVEQTLSRIHRFRDDVAWHTFDSAPSPADLAGVDVWVDPAVEENDCDGFAAEALVVGLPVVAARTPVNAARLEQGRTGWLVPPRDPNEMTHAILAALFKPEVAQTKIQAAKQTASKFRSRQRLRVLMQMYETLIR